MRILPYLLLMAEPGGESGGGTGGAGGAPPPVPAPWTAPLHADFEKDPGLTRFTQDGQVDLGKLYGSYREMEKKLGEGLKPPGTEATDEQRLAWKKALGVPETPQAYTVTDPQLPEGHQFDPELKTQFLELSHKIDLTPTQVQELLQFQAQMTTNAWGVSQAQAQEAVRETERLGQEKWGLLWQSKLALAHETLQRHADPAMQERFGGLVVKNADGRFQAGMGEMGLIEFWADYAQAMGHAPFIVSEGGTMVGKATAEARVDQAYADRAAGKISTEELSRIINQFGPLAFAR